MMPEPDLPRETQYELSPFERDLLRKLRKELTEHRRQIEQRPCCVFEDPMWWLLK